MTEILNEIEANEITDRSNLGVVYRVERLEPIPNKDRIELVHLVDCGYTVVCEKGHQIDDLVLFVKYDSVVPQVSMFDFMREFKYRVKPKSFTVRDDAGEIVSKMYSQGIAIPMKVVYEYIDSLGQAEAFGDFQEGEDLTEILEIKKYIPPVMNSGSSFGVMARKGDFPTHIVSKTDELNLASKMRALEEIKGMRVYITQKVEGSSCTKMWDDARDELMVCSRNNQIGEHETNKFWQAVNKRQVKDKLAVAREVAVQSELYGIGIQKNKLGIPDVDLAVFSVSEKGSKRRFGYDELVEFCAIHNLPMVKVVAVIDNFQMTFDELQQLADAQTYPSGELAEGIVIRPCEPFFSSVLKELWSVKVINRDYKLN